MTCHSDEEAAAVGLEDLYSKVFERPTTPRGACAGSGASLTSASGTHMSRPANVKEVDGDVLQYSQADVIVHQWSGALVGVERNIHVSFCLYLLYVACSNCRTTSGRGQGLAKAVFQRYPKANCYRSVSKPGTVQLVEVSNGDRAKPLFVCNLFGQIYSGSASGLRDSKEARLVLFQQCLRHLKSTMKTHPILSSIRPAVVIFPARVRLATKTCAGCALCLLQHVCTI